MEDDTEEDAAPIEEFHTLYTNDPTPGLPTAVASASRGVSEGVSIQRVSCSSSPYFYAFFGHHTCKVLVDSGATSTLISYRFAVAAGLVIKPTRNSARQLDKSTVPVLGEVQFTIHYGTLDMEVDGLVNDSLTDCDILAGVPFGECNEVVLHLPTRTIVVMGQSIPYGSKPPSIQHDIYRTQSMVLRNDSSRVLLPGEYVEFTSPTLEEYEGEIAIEPRMDSPMDGQWPTPSITRVIQGSVRIPNDSPEPILLPRLGHIAQIRRVTNPNIIRQLPTPTPPPKPVQPPPSWFSDVVSVDPDNMLSSEQREAFVQANREFDNRFNPRYGRYNGNSGPYKANLVFGPVLPPPSKPCLPFYNQGDLQSLQAKADELEDFGVLAKPEDVGVDVLHASPSFLTKKSDGSWRFVTSFVQLGQFVKVPPSSHDTCDEVLRKLASWKFIIKTDLTAGFFQIPVTKTAMQYLGTVTPYKGLRVYTVSVMGAPGSSEHLHELLCRVFGDMLQEGYLIKIADDLHVCGNSIEELLRNWIAVLQRLEDNNLSISGKKTVICPRTTSLLGWLWSSGTITASPHKISALAKVDQPTTCKQMRSYIGAFKAMSRCIPKYSSLMSPLENSIKGLSGNQHIAWTDSLQHHFKQTQEALSSVQTITIPTPSDKLILTTDASPVNDGIGATLFIVRDNQRYVADHFSLKLKSHQIDWRPCELEALAITAAVRHFRMYIKESTSPLQILTDSKPCVQAFNKLRQGKFSASSRVSNFLSCLSQHDVELCHLKGQNNISSDFGSRNPNTCHDQNCQICTFVKETIDSVVNIVTVKDILTGDVQMPFMNKSAWRSAQQSCPILRKVYAHLSSGTRPSRKSSKDSRDIKRYMSVCTIDDSGLLVIRKSDPYSTQRSLIAVPKDILHGLVTALHLYFKHPTPHQLQLLFGRYFYGTGSDDVIKAVCSECQQCRSLVKVPREVLSQSSVSVPTAPGQLFAADVINRSSQSILTTRDVHTSFTTARVVESEKADHLRSALICETSNIRAPQCTIRVDNAPGFQSLREDKHLLERGISLDFGRVKNPNKNPIAEKCNQELEAELLRIDPSGRPVSDVVLQDAVHLLNTRIRNRNLSARELLFCRDQMTLSPLVIDDLEMSSKQQELRSKNHLPSAISKSTKRSKPSVTFSSPLVIDDLEISSKQQGLSGKNHLISSLSKSKRCSKPSLIAPDIGSLVCIKHEGDKFKAREQYIIVEKQGENAVLQKMNGTKFMAKKYVVPFEHLLLVSLPPTPRASSIPQRQVDSSSSSESDSDFDTALDSPSDRLHDASPSSTAETAPHGTAIAGQRASSRMRNAPDRYGVWADADELAEADEWSD